VNLGWKLAQVVNKTSPENLLDTYHADRHPVGARVVRNTMAQVALSSPDDRHQALRDTMTELQSMDEPRRRIAAMLSGLDIHYDPGEGHPLLGRRVPDLDLHTADGPTRVFTLLHHARPVPLNLGEPGGFSTFLLGRIESGWSTPGTMACGSSRSSARSLRPRPC
jgi:FAD binding domain/Aromatic-ring hydroxylase, C-terminal